MWRYLVGAVAALLLAGGGMLWWRSSAVAERTGLLAAHPSVAGETDTAGALPDPPAASEKTREQKRFSRYDKDRDGKVSREEYLAQRRKAFAKLDTNGDGKLGFDEWAIKAETKFADADKDKTGVLTAEEFATTRVQRKTKPRANCPPAGEQKSDDQKDDG